MRSWALQWKQLRGQYGHSPHQLLARAVEWRERSFQLTSPTASVAQGLTLCADEISHCVERAVSCDAAGDTVARNLWLARADKWRVGYKAWLDLSKV